MLIGNMTSQLVYGEGFEQTTGTPIDTSISSDTQSSSVSSSTSYEEPQPDPEPEDPPYEEPQPDPEPEEPVYTDPPIEEATTSETTPEIQEAAFIYTVSNNEAILIGCKTPALTVLDIPEFIDGYPVTTISEDVFAQCYNTVQINIPYSVKTISEGAFKMCTNLQYIGVATENNHYKSLNGVLYSFDGTSIIAYPADKPDTSYTIADTVLYIGSACFNSCRNLVSLTLPPNLSLIGYSAFNGCINLKELTVNNNVEISKSMFENCNLKTIYGYENSKAESYANMYEIDFQSIGVLETTATTTEMTTTSTTTTEMTTNSETSEIEAESLIYYAPEREGVDNTEKLVMVIIIIAMISLVVAVASRGHKNRNDDDDDQEDDDIDEDDFDEDDDED